MSARCRICGCTEDTACLVAFDLDMWSGLNVGEAVMAAEDGEVLSPCWWINPDDDEDELVCSGCAEFTNGQEPRQVYRRVDRFTDDEDIEDDGP